MFGFVVFIFWFFSSSANLICGRVWQVRQIQNAWMRFRRPLYAMLVFLSFTVRKIDHKERWSSMSLYNCFNHCYVVLFLLIRKNRPLFTSWSTYCWFPSFLRTYLSLISQTFKFWLKFFWKKIKLSIVCQGTFLIMIFIKIDRDG